MRAEYSKVLELINERRSQILASEDNINVKGATYYVSESGDDSLDGLSEATAWRTLKKVSEAKLLSGDGVLFKRGDTFRGMIFAKEGVTYGAYGEGEKPRLYGWDKDLADPSLWENIDTDKHIWRMKEKILDPGTLVFNEGERHSRKLIPSYIGGKFVCRDDEGKDFDMRREMTEDLDIYWYFTEKMTTQESKGETFPIPDMTLESFGDLYLRCDAGNPGEVFASVEALPRRPMFAVGKNNNVKIDNLCIKYVGLHAIAAGTCEGLTVTGCEIGWIGGTIQHYLGTDPNYPQGGRGTVTRFGNAIEIYGGCRDYTVSDCYIYECYDAGITHQVTTFGKTFNMENVVYRNNLVERCVYAIEYFLDMLPEGDGSIMDGILMEGNILVDSGYGWGQQRHNKNTPALIKGWSYVNKARNYKIRNNIFCRSAYRMLHLVALDEESLPEMSGNTYVQHKGGMIGQYGANGKEEPEIKIFDEGAAETVERVFKDACAKVIAAE